MRQAVVRLPTAELVPRTAIFRDVTDSISPLKNSNELRESQHVFVGGIAGTAVGGSKGLQGICAVNGMLVDQRFVDVGFPDYLRIEIVTGFCIYSQLLQRH